MNVVLNRVILMGRLCADPDFRQTQNGVAMCRIRVAVDRGYTSKSTGERQADFINVICWRQQAEFVSRYFRKGSMIIVEGRLQNADYTDANGVKHYSMEVQADNVSFGESKKAADTSQNAAQGNHNGNPQNYPPTTQNAYSTPQAADPVNNGVHTYAADVQAQLGDLSDFEEILGDGDVPF